MFSLVLFHCAPRRRVYERLPSSCDIESMRLMWGKYGKMAWETCDSAVNYVCTVYESVEGYAESGRFVYSHSPKGLNGDVIWLNS